MKHQFDVIIVGAGLAGLRAAVEIEKDAQVAADKKVERSEIPPCGRRF